MYRKLAVFGVVLAAAWQPRCRAWWRKPQRHRVEQRARPRVMMLDGRGAQIGVMVDDVNADELKSLGSAPGGVRIEEVDQDSPAAKAGLREGDIVIEVDGDRVRSARQFSRLIQETPAGRSVRSGLSGTANDRAFR